MKARSIKGAAALMAGSMLVSAGQAVATEPRDDGPGISGRRCEPISAKNRIEPPPPLEPAFETPAVARAAARFAAENELRNQACPAGEIAYVDYTPPPGGDIKMPPPVRSRDDAVERAAESSPVTARVDGDEPFHGFWYSHVSTSLWEFNQGIEAAVNVADPEVEDGHSVAQIYVGQGDYSIELGWRDLGDGPRLFVYVNKDGYESHGVTGGSCYNCHFMPHLGTNIVPNQRLSPSANNLELLRLGLRSWQGRWWIWVGDRWIGYIQPDAWPTPFEWGEVGQAYGEVAGQYAYTTDMGNGHFGSDPRASMFYDPQLLSYKDGQRIETDIPLYVYSTRPYWYDAGFISESNRTWKFGGPGAG